MYEKWEDKRVGVSRGCSNGRSESRLRGSGLEAEKRK